MYERSSYLLVLLMRSYSLRLASHLYSEHLLDRGQYLDWVIASTRDSDLDSLPLWLLVTQIHQQEIIQHSQQGRRLTEAMLEHLYKVGRQSLQFA